MKKRLSKALAAAGIASRRGAEKIIAAGRVTVNGEKVVLPQALVEWGKDKIAVDKNRLRGEEHKLYFAFHKPAGCICSSLKKPLGAKRVLDFFGSCSCRLFTVGRLDLETTGLILVTNDGQFSQKVIHPSNQISKEYLAKTGNEITFEHLKTISEGIQIEGCHVRPLSVKKVRRGTLKMSVSEGKKHEVRLLLAKAGLTVRELIRIRIGPITLSNLPLGCYRPLSLSEIQAFP